MMKTTNSLLVFLFLAAWGAAQPAAPHAAFAARKQTIHLSTGIAMRYVAAGDSGGIPVILLHGYTDTGRSFQPMIDELIKRHRRLRIIAPDLRGHGGTTMPDAGRCAAAPEACFRPEDFAADILDLMDRKGIDRAFIVGHSMGSIIAQELALHHPERVRGLVLIGAFVNGRESSVIQDFLIGQLVEGAWKSRLEQRPGFRWPQDAYDLTPADLGPDVSAFLEENWVTEACAPPDFLDAVLPETAHTPLGTWIGALRMQGAVDNRAALEALRTPTLVLWATQDALFIDAPDQVWVRSAMERAAGHGGGRMVYKTYGKQPLPEAGRPPRELGHNLHWAAPGEVAADVVAFIKHGFPEKNLPYVDPLSGRVVIAGRRAMNIHVWDGTNHGGGR